MLSSMLSTFLVIVALAGLCQATHGQDEYLPIDMSHGHLTFQRADKNVLLKDENKQVVSDDHDRSDESSVQQEQLDADVLLSWIGSRSEVESPPPAKLGVRKLPLEVSQKQNGLLTPEQVKTNRLVVHNALTFNEVRFAGRPPKSKEELEAVIEGRKQFVATNLAATEGILGKRRRKKRSIKNYPSFKWKNGIIPGVFSPSLS